MAEPEGHFPQIHFHLWSPILPLRAAQNILLPLPQRSLQMFGDSILVLLSLILPD